ncbi:hypothetical protein ATY77_26670 [Rhizobium sp. R634]|uniref:hypothetical protein n=1 Tax=Rhizobium sp. R634 TaxID=1764274 RepID=UPI000B530C8A|nr:hypothetical protein [Rhizobium sp. R634]OWV79574.1 hypothetical protein ATY77_26670 [Rhizobium sp. R634]
MRELSSLFVDLINRALGSSDPAAAETAARRPWIGRGVADAVDRLRISSVDEAEAVSLWSFAFEAGAQSAVCFARIVLSDPLIKGRELEALKLIEEGADHAEIIAKLQAPTPRSALPQPDSKVIAFPSHGGRA